MVKKLICTIAAAAALISSAAAAGDIYKTDTRQIYCFKDIMRVYADIEDKDGAAAELPDTSSVIGYIDGNKLTARSTARFSETGEPAADIFLVDTSGSIRDKQLSRVKESIKQWARNMKTGDKMAVITFGDDIETKIDYSDDVSAIDNAVAGIENNDRQTRLYGGIMEALEMTDRNDESLPKRKNIILMTDGVNDYNGGITEDDIYSELKARLIPIYSMWFSNSRADNSKGLSTLNSVAEYSGGTTYNMDGKNIDDVHYWIKSGIMNACVIDFAYDGAEADNNPHTFSMSVSKNGKTASDNVKFIMKKSGEESGKYSFAPKGSEADTTSTPEKSDEEAAEESSENDGSGKSNKKLIIIITAAGAALICLTAALAVQLSRRKRRISDDIISGAGSGFSPSSSSGATVIDTDRDKTAAVYNNAAPLISLVSVKNGMQLQAPIEEKITIGRNSSNSVVINNAAVSGYHANILCQNGTLYIEDAGSRNGTTLNGIYVNEPRPINCGDVLSFGNDEYYVNF